MVQQPNCFFFFLANLPLPRACHMKWKVNFWIEHGNGLFGSKLEIRYNILLRACLDITYFAETENLLLKVL